LINHSLGLLEVAAKHYDVSLRFRRDLGDRAGEAITLTNLALLTERRNDLSKALQFLQLAIAIAEEIQHYDLEDTRGKLREVATKVSVKL